MTMVTLSVPTEWRGEESPAADGVLQEVAAAVRASECPHCGLGALHPATEGDLGGSVLLLVCDHPSCKREVLMPTQRVQTRSRQELTAEQRERMQRLSF